MKKITRPIAVPAAVLVFFLMAGVGTCWDVAPHAVALKAGIGAVVTYVIVSFFVRIVINMMVDSMVRKKLKEIANRNKVLVNE